LILLESLVFLLQPQNLLIESLILPHKLCHLLAVLFLTVHELLKCAVSLFNLAVLLAKLITVSLERLYLLRKVFNYRVDNVFIALFDLGQACTHYRCLRTLIECGNQRVEALTNYIQQMLIIKLWLTVIFIPLLVALPTS
jgi:hypothetical protein